jgi:hypothetical protein
MLIAASSGNFGQALAYACSLLQKSCIVVMPTTSAKVKIDAVREYGAQVELVDVGAKSRAERLRRKRDRQSGYLGAFELLRAKPLTRDSVSLRHFSRCELVHIVIPIRLIFVEFDQRLPLVVTPAHLTFDSASLFDHFAAPQAPVLLATLVRDKIQLDLDK